MNTAFVLLIVVGSSVSQQSYDSQRACEVARQTYVNMTPIPEIGELPQLRLAMIQRRLAAEKMSVCIPRG